MVLVLGNEKRRLCVVTLTVAKARQTVDVQAVQWFWRRLVTVDGQHRVAAPLHVNSLFDDSPGENAEKKTKGKEYIIYAVGRI